MKSPKAPGPTQADLDLQAAQKLELDNRNKQLAEDRAKLDAAEAKKARDAERLETSRGMGRVGARSLLTGDWTGFARGGDLGAR